uniref:Transcriptional regulator n=1 Tax=Elaeophora elaphi TaxID=1147741 RepID=A0A0R3RLX5_9BILA
MYILADESDFTNQIIKLITDASIDIEQHIIGNVKEIISREPIICICVAADCEAVKCVIPYLNVSLIFFFVNS